ncbi:acetyl-CoA carboxylase biotin carboxyl carrier protein [Lutimonas halocynthiae]|uniref:acetyl-CoA carboxylase biotin carboxyl carrier protein n=1 Tax=Lutimonas halocynthiae TaxID=1446477 RepID=UPI0025B35C86|nr:acetyl-CoA carboxylase biotin carboxyl carrier protein [Lutimonas halocynthiae]MDN3643117.1 acetyl-CoA carboxylase biotin carboxyl carrier protein [Lutimonas halocynthiae]
MDLKEIQNLIKFVAKSGANEVKLEMGDVKITIKTGAERHETNYFQQAAPVSMPVQAQPEVQGGTPVAADSAPVEANEADDTSKYIEIKSPIIGTLYRKPSPDKPVFVKVGDTIEAGDTVCIIEAMKLFNEVESEVSGKIVKVLIEDSSPVEFDQPLFLIDPS